jgi:hypothetical protein
MSFGTWNVFLAFQMDGWMNGWMDGWMDGGVNEWMNVFPSNLIFN